MAATAPKPRPRLEIGRIGAPHGLLGELHVSMHLAGSDALERVRTIVAITPLGERELEVRAARPHGRGVLLKVVGVTDRDAAAALRGSRIEVERSALPPLDPGEYYLVDLVGATVLGPTGTMVGEVVGVATHPSVACVSVRLSDGRVAELPLSEPWVTKVDAEAGRIELGNLDGLVV